MLSQKRVTREVKLLLGCFVLLPSPAFFVLWVGQFPMLTPMACKARFNLLACTQKGNEKLYSLLWYKTVNDKSRKYL